MGLRNWLCGTDDGATVAETPDDDPRDDGDDESEKQRPYPVETDSFSETVERTALGEFSRTVELVSAVNGQNILIEYDHKKQTGQTTTYHAYSDAVFDARWPGSVSIKPQFDTDLIELNESNILSRKTLGSYRVSLKQRVTVEINGVSIVDSVESIPDECCRAGGSPKISDNSYGYDDDNNYVVAKDGGPGLHNYGYRDRGFYHVETDEGTEFVYVKRCRAKTALEEMSTEPSGSTPDVIANSIETGTDVMRAVLSDGTVVMPDDEQGIDEDGSDMMRIAELASRCESI